jgi:hypothetical protein
MILHIPNDSFTVSPGIRDSITLGAEDLKQELIRMTDAVTVELFDLADYRIEPVQPDTASNNFAYLFVLTLEGLALHGYSLKTGLVIGSLFPIMTLLYYYRHYLGNPKSVNRTLGRWLLPLKHGMHCM